MPAAQQFHTSTHNGVTYVSTEYRGVEYTVRRDLDGYGVHTRRLALGRYNLGGFKRFDTLEALAAGCKAFASADLVAELLASHAAA